MHCLGAFGAVGAEPGPKRLTHGKDEIANPCHRQIGEDFIVAPQIVELGGGSCGLDHVAVGQHHALGLAGGARGIEHHTGGIVIQLGLTRLKLSDMFLAVGAAQFLHSAVLVELGMVVFAQATRIEVDHPLKVGQLTLHFDDLVDLLLIAHDGKTCATVAHDIGHLFGIGVLVQRHRHGPGHLCGHHCPIESWPVAANNGDKIALVQTQLQEPECQRLNLVAGLRPGPALPDPVFLLPIGGGVCEFTCVAVQQRRHGLRSVGTR